MVVEPNGSKLWVGLEVGVAGVLTFFKEENYHPILFFIAVHCQQFSNGYARTSECVVSNCSLLEEIVLEWDEEAFGTVSRELSQSQSVLVEFSSEKNRFLAETYSERYF